MTEGCVPGLGCCCRRLSRKRGVEFILLKFASHESEVLVGNILMVKLTKERAELIRKLADATTPHGRILFEERASDDPGFS